MAKKAEETGVRKRKTAQPEVEAAPEAAPKPKKSRAKAKEPDAAVIASSKEANAPVPKEKRPRTKKAGSQTAAGQPSEIPVQTAGPIEDPIGDTTDGEGRFSLHDAGEMEPEAEISAYRAETADDALEGTLESHRPARETSAQPESIAAPALEAAAGPVESESGEVAGEEAAHFAEARAASGPPPRLDRLQKILSQAGIASRRHAEEMIEAGRVMVNGQVVTQLGAKADPARDHIRVDGKLLSGAERHRYFMLNKPRGFVTTVSDPEGRPTVMQFFAKMNERLYPVGRLDYDSEGLLLVTNDGELANELTRAASGVEKTYLVKVAGQLTQDDLDQLRAGVRIERGEPGSPKIHTAPAEIRQIRQGENPWYEVVLIEGRNRELRKMFQSVGHFVEKIRRVGYGPLVLDLEPGKVRELAADEVNALRRAAQSKPAPRSPQKGPRQWAGKSEPAQSGPRPQGDQRRPGSMPRRETGRPSERSGARGTQPPGAKSFRDREPREAGRAGQRSFPESPRREKPFREPSREPWKPREERPGGQRPFRGKPDFATGPRRRFDERGPKPEFENRPRKDWEKPAENRGQKPQGRPSGRFDRSRGEAPGSRPGRSWNRPEHGQGRGQERGQNRGQYSRPPGGEDKPRPARGPANRPPGERPSRPPSRPGPGRNDGAAPSGPRGFAPGRFSEPGGRRFGSRSGPKSGPKSSSGRGPGRGPGGSHGGARRGGKPPDRRGRG